MIELINFYSIESLTLMIAIYALSEIFVLNFSRVVGKAAFALALCYFRKDSILCIIVPRPSIYSSFSRLSHKDDLSTWQLRPLHNQRKISSFHLTLCGHGNINLQTIGSL